MAAKGDKAIDITGAMVESVSAADWLLVVPVALPMMAGALLLMFRRSLWLQALSANAVLALNFAFALALLDYVLEMGPRTMTMGRWLPPFGISFSVDAAGAGLDRLLGVPRRANRLV